MPASKSNTRARKSHCWQVGQDLRALEEDVRPGDPDYCTRKALEASRRYGNRDTLRKHFGNLHPIVQWVSLDSYNNHVEDTHSQGRRDDLLGQPELAGMADLWYSGFYQQASELGTELLAAYDEEKKVRAATLLTKFATAIGPPTSASRNSLRLTQILGGNNEMMTMFKQLSPTLQWQALSTFLGADPKFTRPEFEGEKKRIEAELLLAQSVQGFQDTSSLQPVGQLPNEVTDESLQSQLYAEETSFFGQAYDPTHYA